MTRVLASTFAAAAAYGFAAGSIHSWTYAFRNLVKFPLLVAGTALICSLACWIGGRFLAPGLTFSHVQGLVWRVYRDVALLLCALSPIALFLSLAFERPSASSLGEYPLYLGINVLCIAVAGSLALARRSTTLLRAHQLSSPRTALLVAVWMSLSLAVGGQWSWYLRPFFGVATIPAGPFCLGNEPDFRGARSFYEAVYHVVRPPRRCGAATTPTCPIESADGGGKTAAADGPAPR